ncbi:MAG: phospholipase [Anaerolineae bacterium]|nr:phospholipase [Anaerolineae bacterium]
MIPLSLAEQIHHLVADMPVELVARLAAALQDSENGRWSQIETRLGWAVSQPDLRQKVVAFVTYWQRYSPETTTESVALAVLTASQVANHYRQMQQLELVWTGPDSQVIPLRRTDQALLQLIREARESLHIVSFAVYKAENITQALVAAAERGVSIAIYLETPDASEGKMSFDTVKALGTAIQKRARLYMWPREKRPLTEDGRFGSLHAKIALADRQTLLISSANLTDYAMTLNMEMGILVRGGEVPKHVESLLLNLLERGVFVKI